MFSCSRFYKANAAAISITQNPAKVAELRSTTLPFSANLSLRSFFAQGFLGAEAQLHDASPVLERLIGGIEEIR